jgi:glycerol-3-phosphate cytidylyltransferase
MKTVLTYGTFDLLHVGHIRILMRAKAMGDRLIVGLSTDEFNQKKHKSSFMPYEQRKEILEAIKYVDMVIPETCWEQKINDVKDHKVDVFVMGDDWIGEFDFLKEHCDVVYLERTQDISSTAIKGRLA